MNCMEVIAPMKKTVGIARAWMANHLTVMIGYLVLAVSI